MAASKRGDAIRAAVLALLLAALTLLPPPALSDGSRATTPASLAVASAAGTSATGHRLELQLQERSAPAWPGSQSSQWAVTGPAAEAAPELVSTASAAEPTHATNVNTLANRGRAPPRSVASPES